MINFWIERSSKVLENEILLVRNSPSTKDWFNKMPSRISAIYPARKKLRHPTHFKPIVGFAHHMRLTRFGIEGVFHAPRKYHRYAFYVLHDKINHPGEPFWLVLHKG